MQSGEVVWALPVSGCEAAEGTLPVDPTGPRSGFVDQERQRGGQAGSRSLAAMRERNWSTALVWIWHTRLSVTPSTSPISARVRPS